MDKNMAISSTWKGRIWEYNANIKHGVGILWKFSSDCSKCLIKKKKTRSSAKIKDGGRHVRILKKKKGMK